MGQTLGRAPVPRGGKKFLSLPRSCIFDLWEAFNDIAEGFGLTIEEFQDIVKSGIMEHLNVTERQLNIDTDNIFKAFDDDENNLVDSLEFLSAFAMLSGMTPEEKIRFIFAMYDFDESGVLTIDEMVLAFRSSLSGLTKLSKVDPPTESEIEAIVVLAFDSIRKNSKQPQDRASDYIGIDKEAFVKFCLNSPEVTSWIEYFDDLEEYSSQDALLEKPIRDPSVVRGILDEASMNPALGGLHRLEHERAGANPALQNWENVLPFLKPARKVDPENEKKVKNPLPNANVSLEWIYGFNAHSSRQALAYTAKGCIIYPAGAVCIVQDVEKNEQNYFVNHTDLITCMKVFTTEEGATIVASGENGRRPAVHIWEAETRVLLSTLQGFHRNSITQLDFSPNREKLVTLGMDTYHCIAVYEWRTRKRIWAARTTNLHVYDVRFLSNDILASCGEEHVHFWREMATTTTTSTGNNTSSNVSSISAGSGVYKRYRGHFGTAHNRETQWCVGSVGKTIFSGSDTGMLYVWEGRTVLKAIKAHTGAIYAAYTIDQGDEKGLVTGCSAGKIQVWNANLEIGATFNAAALGAIDSCINALCCDVLTAKILVGFRTCEIFEVDYTDGRNVHNSAVVAGHFNPKVSGIAAHPMQAKYFCSVGDDKTVRIFDCMEHRALRVSMLDTIGHCCAYSADGQILIIGLGSGVEGREERKEGAFVALSEEDLTLLHEARDSKNMIADVKFAPNGDKFAMASHDGSIYVYDFKKYRSRAQCRGHTGKVEHVDFSSNSQFLMTNCSNGDLLFWDAETGELQPPKAVKNVQWSTNSCVFSVATQGLWQKLPNGMQITKACKTHAQDMLFAVDNYGHVKVTPFPANAEGRTSAFLLCHGHAKNVQNCQVSCDDERIFTSGGTDGSIIQWKISRLEDVNYDSLKKEETIGELMPVEMKFEGKLLEKPENYENVINFRPVAVCKMEEGDEDMGQILPWQKSVVAPSRVPPEDTSEPPDSLELDFVYGFNWSKSRESLMYAPTGEVLFFVGSVAVLMNQRERQQRFYNQHTSAITAMAVFKVDPDMRGGGELSASSPQFLTSQGGEGGNNSGGVGMVAPRGLTGVGAGVVATGDHGEIPNIRVWNVETLNTLVVLRGYHRRAINHLKFSPDGTLLVTVGHDSQHSIAVYDWRNAQILSETYSFENKSLFVDFNPSGTGLVHCGNEIIRFWSMKGRNMTFTDAFMGSRAKLQGFLCAGWIGSNAVVGTTDGNLYRFLDNRLDSIVLAHSSAVNCISYANDGICTGSADGFVKIWTRFLECRLVVEISNLRAVGNVVRGVAWDSEAGRILFGTSSSEIYELNAGDGENLHVGALLEGHGGDELWGLAVNPLKEEFCTVGDDAFLRVWNAFTHTAIAAVALEMPARCCAFSPDGRNLAIGFGSPKKLSNRQFDGKWVVLDADDYQVTHEARDSTKWLTEIKYSPNGELLAIGGYDNKIYIYSVAEGYALNATIGQHQSFITSVDFSDDSQWLQSNCGGLELHFFEADTGLFIPAPSRLRDVVWSTQNCTMGWSVQGIWPAQKDGTECTVADCNLFRGDDGTLVASGDSYGRVRLFRFPCTSSFAAGKTYWSAASAITRVRFLAGDSFLVTLAGEDKAILQWRHKRDREENIAYDVLNRRGKIEEDEEDVMGLFGLAGSELEVLESDLTKLVSSRPWMASMVAPTDYEEGKYELDGDADLRFVHAFGLQSSVTRSSVLYTNESDLIYPTSKYVCVFNKKMNTQIRYMGHSNEITCVATSKDGLIVASAEKSKRPEIHLWDSSTCEGITALPFFHRRGVVSMQFSVDRTKLVSVGQDPDYSIALWLSPSGSWADGRILATAKGDVNPVLFCSFYDQNLYNPTGFVLGSGGRYNMKFWRVDGNSLNPYYAEYEKKHKIGTLLCGNAMGGHKFLSGSTTGHLFVWNGRVLDRMVRAHEMAVSCIWSSQQAGIITAAKDGVIKQWTPSLEHVRTFMLAEADIPPVLSSVRSIDAFLSANINTSTTVTRTPTATTTATASASGTLASPPPAAAAAAAAAVTAASVPSTPASSNPKVQHFINRILITTSGGEIFEASAKSGAISLVHEAHHTGELWGLCTHPIDPDVFATTGDDKTIRVWSISAKRLLRKAVIDCTARCINWSPDGSQLIIGMGGSQDGKRQRKDGAFLLLESETLKPIFEGRDSRHWITEAKFSPDNASFAVASMDHKIYIYAHDSLRLKGTCDRHNSHVLGFDFSSDSSYIQSDAGDFEHLYHEAEDGEYFSAASQLKDIQWSEWTCNFGWPIQGAWPYFSDVESGRAAEPTCVHRSPNAELLAVGDTLGVVKLYPYPCIAKDPPLVSDAAHVGEVSKVRFSCDGKYLISTGKMDRSVKIWRVVRRSTSSSSN